MNRRLFATSLGALAAPWPVGAMAAPLSIPGAGPPEAALRVLAAEFSRANPGISIDVPKSIGIAGGLRLLNTGASDLVRLARRLSDDELRAGGLTQRVYASDAVVFATGRGAPVDNITEAQALGLFSGQIDDWAKVGGKPAPVLVFYREPTEIAHQGIKRHLPAFAGVGFSPAAKLANSDSDMVDGLTRYRDALGWLPLSAVLAAGGQIHALGLNGVRASQDTLASGRYRIVIEHVLAYRDKKISDEARRFLAFVTSPSGTRVLHTLNLLPSHPTNP